MSAAFDDRPVGLRMALSARVARVLAPNPSPFTYTGTQTYLVGTDDLAVIDPGPDDPAHLDALMAAIADRPVRAILCTHTHRDHSPASRALSAQTGAPIIGCAPLSIDTRGPRADASFDQAYAPDRVLGDGEGVAGADWTILAVATPGHTSNHLCFALSEEGALFTGDHVMGWSTTVVFPPDGDMADYMASMARLLDRPDVVYYPAHGDPVTDPHRLVRGMMGHRKQREGQILRHLEREGPAAVPDMVAAMYRGIDTRLHVAAGGSVLAHLIDLAQQNRVVQQEDGTWRLTS